MCPHVSCYCVQVWSDHVMLHSSFSLHYLVLFSNERGAATVATPDSNVDDTGTKFTL
jgi:hypothetical protein